MAESVVMVERGMTPSDLRSDWRKDYWLSYWRTPNRSDTLFIARCGRWLRIGGATSRSND